MASSTSAGKPKPVRLPLRLRVSGSGALRRSCCKSSVSDAREKAVAYGVPDIGAGATTDGIEQHLKGAVEGPKLSAKSPPIRLGQVSSANRKSTRLNSSHLGISYAVFCLKKKKKKEKNERDKKLKKNTRHQSKI